MKLKIEVVVEVERLDKEEPNESDELYSDMEEVARSGIEGALQNNRAVRLKCSDGSVEHIIVRVEDVRLASTDLLEACKAVRNLFRTSDMRPEDECHDLYVQVADAIAKEEGK